MSQRFIGVKMLAMWLYAFFTVQLPKVLSFTTTKKAKAKLIASLNLVIDILMVLAFSIVVILIQYICDKVSLL